MYRINKISIIIVVFAAALFTACEKEPIDLMIDPLEPIEVEVEEKSENALIKSAGKTSTTGFAMDCITIIYPFDFELESGATITVNDSIEVESVLLSEEDYVIDFVYPVEATNQNGDIITINNIEEMAEAFIECVPTEGWDDFENAGFPAFEFDGLCVDLVYPFSLESENGTVTTVLNEQEFADALANAYYYFSFPISLVDSEGNTTFTNNEEELINALFNCDTNNEPHTYICPFDYGFCFEIVYPVSLIDALENISVVNNEDELYTLLFTDEVIDFVYPITVTFEDGITSTIGDQNEFNNAIADCFYYQYPPIDYPPFGYEFCFLFDYPVSLTNYAENIIVVNNEEELYNSLYATEGIDFVYPITIFFEDSTTNVIENQNEFNIAIADCWDINFEYPYGYEEPSFEINEIFNFLLTLELGCFDINYPITIDFENEGNIVSDETALEYLAIEIFASDYFSEIEISYPITATLNSDSSVITINESADLLEYIINGCP